MIQIHGLARQLVGNLSLHLLEEQKSPRNLQAGSSETPDPRCQNVLLYTLGVPPIPFPSTTLAGFPHPPLTTTTTTTAIESQVPFRSFCKHASIGVSMQSCSGYAAFRYFPLLRPEETDRVWIGFITFLNTFATGVGSLEIIQFVIGQPGVMFSGHRIQGVDSTQLVLSLAGSIFGLWL